MQLTGTIKRISATQNVSDKFSKREFVVMIADDKYPQYIQLEMHQDNCSKLDGLAEGQDVACEINLRGREWTSPTGEVKYFNTLVCWKIEAVGGAPVKTITDEINDSENLPF